MDKSKIKILLVDDDEDDYVLIHHMLTEIREPDFQMDWVNNYPEARRRLKTGCWDAILIDYDLGNGDGMELIREAVEMEVKAPLIMVTGRGRYELDVEAMKSGAADYLPKNMINSAFLERVIRFAIERSRSKETLDHLVQERTQEMENALEELRVAEEELRTQHEELIKINKSLEGEYAFHIRMPLDFPTIELITDGEGKILDTSNEAAASFLSSGSPIQGKLLSLFIHLSDRKRFSKLITRLGGLIHPYTEQFSLNQDSHESNKWCVTVSRLTTRGIPGSEYYWLLHPIYQVD